MSVVATGSAPLSYQWYVGMIGSTASPIGGATSSGYTTPALIGNTRYWVRVSNAGSSKLEHVSLQSVDPEPVTKGQSLDQIAIPRASLPVEIGVSLPAPPPPRRGSWSPVRCSCWVRPARSSWRRFS